MEMAQVVTDLRPKIQLNEFETIKDTAENTQELMKRNSIIFFVFIILSNLQFVYSTYHDIITQSYLKPMGWIVKKGQWQMKSEMAETVCVCICVLLKTWHFKNHDIQFLHMYFRERGSWVCRSYVSSRD